MVRLTMIRAYIIPRLPRTAMAVYRWLQIGEPERDAVLTDAPYILARPTMMWSPVVVKRVNRITWIFRTLSTMLNFFGDSTVLDFAWSAKILSFTPFAIITREI